MAAVMASDSQILALSTMFTEDVVAFYLVPKRARDALLVQTGRLFVVVVTVVAYLIALSAPQSSSISRRSTRLRVFGADAAARRRAVLERQHTLGRAGDHCLDGRRRLRDRGAAVGGAGAGTGRRDPDSVDR